MSRSTRSRRLLVAALTMTMFLALPAGSASAGTRVKDWVCDYRWRDSPYQVRQLIRCAARRWQVPGGPEEALSVARCESHLDPAAYGGGNAGVFQQNLSYWPDRAIRFGFRGASAYNARANIIVSVRMAHAGGWGAWACA